MLILHFKKDFYNEKAPMEFLPHLTDFCVILSTGAMVGWHGDTLQCG